MMRPIHIHLFGSRKDAFNRDEVLQENIILVAKKEKLDYKEDKVSISYSQGVSDLNNTYRTVPLIETIDIKSKNKVIRIPLSIEDDKIINLVHTWRNTLESLGICISTGPVVAFRSSEHIVGYENSDTYPLLWIQNVKKMKVTWPLINNKKQYIKGINKKLLIANQNLILLRRFSAKEETSRLTAAPFFKNQIDTDFIGIENHLNYIYKKSGDLSEQMVVGLACILNSKILDTYFRTSNGNTQVSATELRDMPFPSQDLIEKLGEYILNNNLISENSDLIINNYIKI
jgi:adenine-specific DNA-methyltransferase